MDAIYNGVVAIQFDLFMRTQRRTDAHYSEGQGALFVYEGEPLTVENVIYVADEMELIMRGGFPI